MTADPAASTAETDRVVRLIRRICLLREQGRREEAGRIEATELVAALKNAPAAAGFAEAVPGRLEKLYAAETDRAADAVVLSELIVAQLRLHFPGAPPGPAAAADASPPAFIRAPSPPGGSPAIPDLLDAMLAHDRAAAGRNEAGAKRAFSRNEKPTTHPHDNHDH